MAGRRDSEKVTGAQKKIEHTGNDRPAEKAGRHEKVPRDLQGKRVANQAKSREDEGSDLAYEPALLPRGLKHAQKQSKRAKDPAEPLQVREMRTVEMLTARYRRRREFAAEGAEKYRTRQQRSRRTKERESRRIKER